MRSSLGSLLVLGLVSSLFGCGGSRGGVEPTPVETKVETPVTEESVTEEQTEEEAAEEHTEEKTPVSLGEFVRLPDAGLAESARRNQFGFDLYSLLRSAKGNLVFSPGSVQLALGMAYGGAQGETASQMAHALRLGREGQAVHARYGAALGTWNATEGATLRVANRLFLQKGVALEPKFEELTREVYGAPVEPLDFAAAPEPSRARINAWVEEHTEQRIRDLLPRGAITSLTRVVLTNAVYFKGTWKRAFGASATRDRLFWVEGSEQAYVPTMHVEAPFRFAHLGDELSLLETPYAGDQLRMVWLLPHSREGLPALEEKLSAAALEAWRKKAREVEVEVRIPRFKLEPPSIRMSAALEALGMSLPFSPDADFTGIARIATGLYIEEVFHKAFIEVNEQGTEAAAATAVVMATRGMAANTPPKPPKPTFIAEHPFIFALVDDRTGAVLFLGRVVDPR